MDLRAFYTTLWRLGCCGVVIVLFLLVQIKWGACWRVLCHLKGAEGAALAAPPSAAPRTLAHLATDGQVQLKHMALAVSYIS